MALLENGRPVPDRWTFVPDGVPLPLDGPVIVTLSRLRREAEDLRGRPPGVLPPDVRPPSARFLGVKLTSAELAPEVAEFLDLLSLVAVEFPKFRDGRGFSTARELRERYGFRGEIRAVGHTLPDQYRFLLRCGFDTVEMPDDRDPAAWAAALEGIGIAYQPAMDAAAPVSLLRRRLAAGGGA
ncbi:DUF934 domain-containing protein [Rhodospirillum centenum]|uniref:Oxidoreductase probably involved in sulfite reduction n=1 Tax=Rhodospirillum centenum (strain ATCC 51521 / SW) TaxID=414684 RepID=B6IP65_RHOCS|nr:DUF934 domain-containing protein [Rhodospirillum centenum]ACI99567.1 conserved hypothetical protein [Rhodospirillum centenum SW]